jgi:hypothetical protein
MSSLLLRPRPGSATLSPSQSFHVDQCHKNQVGHMFPSRMDLQCLPSAAGVMSVECRNLFIGTFQEQLQTAQYGELIRVCPNTFAFPESILQVYSLPSGPVNVFVLYT